MPEPLAIIDTTHPMQQTTTSERVDDVYATTDEALYGQSTTAEVRRAAALWIFAVFIPLLVAITRCDCGCASS
jgi:hypothetical protein